MRAFCFKSSAAQPIATPSGPLSAAARDFTLIGGDEIYVYKS